MAVSRVKTSSVLQGFAKYRTMLAGNAAYSPSSYESIATATGTGSSGTITFSSIPSTYTSLQIRIIAFSTSPYIGLQFNGDTAANYAWHTLTGNGTTVSASGATAATSTTRSAVLANTNYGTAIIDIHNYTSTTQNKTTRSLTGWDDNGSGTLVMSSGLWLSTSAITSITLTNPGNFNTSSTFALYGIKGS